MNGHVQTGAGSRSATITSGTDAVERASSVSLDWVVRIGHLGRHVWVKSMLRNIDESSDGWQSLITSGFGLVRPNPQLLYSV